MNFQEKAEYFLNKYEQRTRESGEKYYCAKDLSDTEARDLSFACHENGNMFPDDHRYEFMIEALEIFSECDGENEAEDRIYEIEADIYTSDLTEWLNSNNSRVYYLTEVLEETGTQDGFTLLSMAQQKEKEEAARCVLNFLCEYEEE